MFLLVEANDCLSLSRFWINSARAYRLAGRAQEAAWSLDKAARFRRRFAELRARYRAGE